MLHCDLRDQMVEAVNRLDLSHAEIARRSGIARSTISRVLNGDRTGTIETWSYILQACNLEVNIRSNK